MLPLVRMLLLSLLAAMLGCASPPSIPVTEWRVGGRTVTLPGDVAPLLPARGGIIHMTADVPVPPELRGGPVSFAILVNWCSPAVTANGAPLDDVHRSLLDGDRSQGAHLYRVPGALVGERLALTMDIEDTHQWCTTFDSPPILARGDFGSLSFITVRRLNEIAPLVFVSILPVLTAALLILYVTGGRRPSHLWAAIATMFLLGNPLGMLGISHYLVGYRADAFYMMTTVASALALLWFTHAYLELAPPSKAWPLLAACAIVAMPLVLRRYDEDLTWAMGALVAVPLLFRTLATLARHRSRSRNGPLLLASFSVSVALWLLESAGPRIGLHGARISYLGGVIIACAILTSLMRDFAATTLDLRAQLAAAQVRQTEILGLTDELRHQVAQRSRELRDVLVRTEGFLAPERPAVGDIFDGRYRIVSDLGAGGMGAVFEAERRSDARRFALKVVTGRVTGEGAARFAREAEIGATMTHPNLVAIVDVGIARSTTPFLVMELVRGGSLESMRGRFGDVAWGRPLLAQVAEALAALHANGIIHRDLKPGNVLLEQSDGGVVAKVADFGISRIDAPDAPPDALAATAENAAPGQRLTGTGMMLGTPFYMAPESSTGKVGPPSDVFSFGVLAYEVLTGRLPFAVPPVLLAMSTQPFPRPEGEALGIWGIVLSCMAEDPAARPSARSLASALDGLP